MRYLVGERSDILPNVVSDSSTQSAASPRLDWLLAIPTRLEAHMAYRYSTNLVVHKLIDSQVYSVVYGNLNTKYY